MRRLCVTATVFHISDADMRATENENYGMKEPRKEKKRKLKKLPSYLPLNTFCSAMANVFDTNALSMQNHCGFEIPSSDNPDKGHTVNDFVQLVHHLGCEH